jgi:hypothetical protein
MSHSFFSILGLTFYQACFVTFFYNDTLVEDAIKLAVANKNVWLEILALFPTEPDGRPRNPSGGAVVQAIKNAGLANQVMLTFLVSCNTHWNGGTSHDFGRVY